MTVVISTTSPPNTQNLLKDTLEAQSQAMKTLETKNSTLLQGNGKFNWSHLFFSFVHPFVLFQMPWWQTKSSLIKNTRR